MPLLVLVTPWLVRLLGAGNPAWLQRELHSERKAYREPI